MSIHQKSFPVYHYALLMSKNAFSYKKIAYKALSILSTERKERRRLRGEKDDGDGGARHKEKRKAKEKVDGFGERRHGKDWI